MYLRVEFPLNVYQFLSVSPSHFGINKKVVRMRSNYPVVLEEWIFLDNICFVVFVDEMEIKVFVYLLITNPSFYESIVNLFEHDMET